MQKYTFNLGNKNYVYVRKAMLSLEITGFMGEVHTNHLSCARGAFCVERNTSKLNVHCKTASCVVNLVTILTCVHTVRVGTLRLPFDARQ